MFAEALRNQDQYLKIVPYIEPLKMPVIQGIKQKKLTIKDQHLNSLLLEQNLEVFHVNPRTKKQKRKKTVFSKGTHATSSNQINIHST